MLIPTRKPAQSIAIREPGGHARRVKVIVLEVLGRSVRLGFEAAADIPVHRLEVLQRPLAQDPVPSTGVPK